jgi:hypothetical protein
MIDFHDNAKIEGEIIMSSMSTQVTPIVGNNQLYKLRDSVHPILLRQNLKKHRAYMVSKLVSMTGLIEEGRVASKSPH